MTLTSSITRRIMPAALWRAAMLLVSVSSTASGRQAPSMPRDSARLTVGAFVDGYYAYDAGRPPTRDRSFAGGALFGTQPARHDEFNVNLAFVEVAMAADRYRGRLAVQFGTSVQSNYGAEPTVGIVSGPGVQQYLQEAVAGYRMTDRLWLDGGIFFSNMGMEGWISRDNLTYSRSLVADYSPYYSTGVKLTYAASSRLTARVDVMNGWQTISEGNRGKGIGARVDFAPDHAVALSYYNFIGNETDNRLRLFHGVGAKVTRGAVTLLGEADMGAQRRPSNRSGSSRWFGLLAVLRVQATAALALSVRAERFDDRDQVILSTGTRVAETSTVANPPFRGDGMSLGIDVAPGGFANAPRLLWRSEVRGFRAAEAVFPDGGRAPPTRLGGFAVTSMALTF